MPSRSSASASEEKMSWKDQLSPRFMSLRGFRRASESAKMKEPDNKQFTMMHFPDRPKGVFCRAAATAARTPALITITIIAIITFHNDTRSADAASLSTASLQIHLWAVDSRRRRRESAGVHPGNGGCGKRVPAPGTNGARGGPQQRYHR
ncbi:hypothetical protein NM208_g12703 [Fusarium decemcellulare]|uniref:Uncharacterized protein n=1 Tax=Fusarium decemcellulare TaxID=57161 RepID=A0ACC1RPM5_9HYPO|nr:hypothetical protein NM208_g12703 [Fusarium decemcellulare]